MRALKTCLLLMCLSVFWGQTQAQLVNVYTGGTLPTSQNWKELRFDNSMVWEQAAKDLLVAPSDISAVAAGSTLKLKTNEVKDVGDRLLYSQLGYYITRPGFSASNGYTVAFRAKVINADGTFSVSGVGEGKGFRLEFSNNLLVEHANVLDEARVLSTASNTDGFHNYHVAVTPNENVWVWRDGALLKKLPLQPFKLDNILYDGGFEKGGTPEDHGWEYTVLDRPGILTVSSNPAHVKTGKYGMFVNEGSHKNNFIPVKSGAIYDMTAWGKNFYYPIDGWRDLNGWHDPVSDRTVYFVSDRNNMDWKYFEKLGMEGGGDYQRFILETMTSDLNVNQMAYDDMHYSERFTASRIPPTAVNLFPNGDFEDPCFHYFPAGDPRNDTCIVNPNNYRYSADVFYGGWDDFDPGWFNPPFNAEHNAAPFWHPFWGARVRMQYQNQAANGESGGHWARGKYSLRFFNCFGHNTTYGSDFTGGQDENRGSNSNIKTVPIELAADGRTYTFLFSYHFAKWGGDHLILVVKNGEKEIFRKTINNDGYQDWKNEAIEFVTDAGNHALQILTERDGGTPGVLYLDDLYLFEGKLLPEDNSHLFFGKPTGVKGAEVEIEYIKIDKTGAKNPEGEDIDPQEWTKKATPLSTTWGDAFPNKAPIPAVLNEYPRPQLKRDNWTNLNGIWDFTSKTLADFGTYKASDAYRQQILVPFPVESGMSGIQLEDYSAGQNKIYCYKLNAAITKPSDSKRVILHFGAVDWESYVFVNGTQVAHHKGGFDPFSADITTALKSGSSQEIVVQAFDPTRGGQPAGKQNPKPGGDQYTPSSGIWQTVWTETVNPTYITGLKLTPVDNTAVKVKVDAANSSGATVTVKILDGATEVASANLTIGKETSITIPSPKLWSPKTPFLYNVKIEVKKDGATDAVTSYFGLRKIEVKKLREQPYIYLNNEVMFSYATLDHGFYPEGIFTPTSYDAMRFDLKKLKELGFNAVRKFEKIEPAIWYHLADSLGLLVWQDIPAAHDATPISELSSVEARKANFLRETTAMTNAIYNSPAVIGWVAFNDGWGEYDYSHVKNTVNLFRSLKDGRLIVPESGPDNYEIGDVVASHGTPPVMHTNAFNERASICDVTGTYGYAINGHLWNTSSASDIKDEATYAQRLKEFSDAAKGLTMRGLTGLAMVQTSDVEGEINGLMTYDRKVYKAEFKADSTLKESTDFMTKKIARPILKTSAQGGELWKYIRGTKDATAPVGWNTNIAFNDAIWQEGLSGFGSDMGWFKPNTDWSGDNLGLFLRKKVEIPVLEPGDQLKFTIAYDEDYEFYINGELAASNTGWSTSYVNLDITSEAAAAINYGGENLFAIHVIQNNGGSAMDIGLTAGKFSKPIDYPGDVPPVPVWIDIATAADWMKIGKDSKSLSGFYRLVNDIDLMNEAYVPIGKPGSPFRGCIDGQYHTVMCPEIAPDGNNVGLFGYADGARFVNLRFTDAAIMGADYADVGILLGRGRGVHVEQVVFDKGYYKTEVHGRDHVGVVAGLLESGKLSTIKDVYVVNAEVDSKDWQVAGLVGIICDTRIINSYFTGTVKILHADRLISDNRDAGGIASRTEGGHNSFNGVMSLASEVRSGSGNEWVAFNGGGHLVIDSASCFVRDNMLMDPLFAPGRGGQFARATESMKRPEASFKDFMRYQDAGWDMNEVWGTPCGGGFPVLRKFFPTACYKDPVTIPTVKVGNNLKMYSTAGNIVMLSAQQAAVWVYNMQGELVERTDFTGTQSIALPQGVYIVKSIVNGDVKAVKIINQ